MGSRSASGLLRALRLATCSRYIALERKAIPWTPVAAATATPAGPGTYQANTSSRNTGFVKERPRNGAQAQGSRSPSTRPGGRGPRLAPPAGTPSGSVPRLPLRRLRAPPSPSPRSGETSTRRLLRVSASACRRPATVRLSAVRPDGSREAGGGQGAQSAGGAGGGAGADLQVQVVVALGDVHRLDVRAGLAEEAAVAGAVGLLQPAGAGRGGAGTGAGSAPAPQHGVALGGAVPAAEDRVVCIGGFRATRLERGAGGRADLRGGEQRAWRGGRRRLARAAAGGQRGGEQAAGGQRG